MSKVLIVEDDLLVADCLEDVLIDAGYEVCGIATTVAEGIRICQQCTPDLGVIDLGLSGGESGTDVAAALCPHGEFGVLYVTGNPEHPLLSEAQGVGCLAKPYSTATLIAALRYISGTMADASPLTVPVGLRMLSSYPSVASESPASVLAV